MDIDENTMKNIKNMVDNGNISEAISQISPEMIENFSKMLSNNENNQNQQTSVNNKNSTQNNNEQSNNIPDLNGIDMNTIMKISSAFKNMNSKSDPRANLLNSLKPYLRDSKKGKLDNYINLLNISKIADIMKDSNKENN